MKMASKWISKLLIVLKTILVATIPACEPSVEKESPTINFCQEFESSNATDTFNNLNDGNKILKYYKLPDHLISPVYFLRDFTDVWFNLASSIQRIPCASETFTLSINLTVPDSFFDLEEREFNPRTYFTPDGHFKNEPNIYSSSQYCIQKLAIDEMVLTICEHPCNSTIKKERAEICIPKCCRMGQALDVSNFDEIGCAFAGGKTWIPTIYETTYQKSPIEHNFHLYIYKPWNYCEDIIVIRTMKDTLTQKRTPFRVLKDGAVVYRDWKDRYTWNRIPNGRFCIEGAMSFPNAEGLLFPNSYTGDEADTVILECTEAEMLAKPQYRILYTTFIAISASCLLITIVVNCLAMENRTTHRLVLMAYFISFCMVQIILLIQHTLPYLAEDSIRSPRSMAHKACVATAIATHFFYLMTFCWLAILSFDIWSTMRSTESQIMKKGGVRRFLYYAVLSSVIPTMIVATALVLQTLYQDEIEGDIVIPDYGSTSCTLEPVHALFYFVYLPVGILLLINTCMFVSTIYNIRVALKSTRAARENNKIQRNSAFMFLRLYIIMGIPFIFEIISWATDKNDPAFPWYVIIMDAITIFQGVVILYLFCLAPSARELIFKKYPTLRRYSDQLTSSRSRILSAYFQSREGMESIRDLGREAGRKSVDAAKLEPTSCSNHEPGQQRFADVQL